MSGQKSWIAGRQIRAALPGEQLAIDPGIANHHLEPLLERFTDDLTIFDILIFHEGNTVWQCPGVTLAGNGAKLVGDSQALLMRCDDGGKEFSGKFMPKMIQKILRRSADAAVVIGRAQNND